MKKGSGCLESRLEAYEKTSHAARPRGGASRRHWQLYAAAAGSGLALTTSAEAEIVYSGPLDVTLAASANERVSSAAHINGDSVLWGVARQTGGVKKGYAFLGGAPGASFLIGAANPGHGPATNSVNLRALASGAKISQGAGAFQTASNNNFMLHYRRTSHNGTRNHEWGSFQRSQTGFAGIKVGSDFGWMKLKWGGTANGFATSVTLLGWAYETDPDTAITAGAVPEPTTGLMALLATGCVGVAAWRKRRPKTELAASA